MQHPRGVDSLWPGWEGLLGLEDVDALPGEAVGVEQRIKVILTDAKELPGNNRVDLIRVTESEVSHLLKPRSPVGCSGPSIVGELGYGELVRV